MIILNRTFLRSKEVMLNKPASEKLFVVFRWPTQLGRIIVCLEKKCNLYRKFWRVLKQLGVWSHPLYLAYKATKATFHDIRNIMPDCVTTVSCEQHYYVMSLNTILQDIRRRYPNPDGIVYTDFIPSTPYA